MVNAALAALQKRLETGRSLKQIESVRQKQTRLLMLEFRHCSGLGGRSVIAEVTAQWEIFMKTLMTVLLATVMLSASLSSVFALGGCGPNRHRNGWGNCVWGGQNQDWCLRRTGHAAVRMPNGNLRCFR